MALRLLRLRGNVSLTSAMFQVRCGSGDAGSGAGKGGGTGGSIRDAGGSFGKMEAAREEEYFRKLQREQLAKLKDSLHDEIHHHKEMIEEHEEKKQILKLKNSLKKAVRNEKQPLPVEIEEAEEAIARHKKKIANFMHMEKEH